MAIEPPVSVIVCAVPKTVGSKTTESSPAAALAATTASRSEQSASQTPSFVSAILVTVKGTARQTVDKQNVRMKIENIRFIKVSKLYQLESGQDAFPSPPIYRRIQMTSSRVVIGCDMGSRFRVRDLSRSLPNSNMIDRAP